MCYKAISDQGISSFEFFLIYLEFIFIFLYFFYLGYSHQHSVSNLLANSEVLSVFAGFILTID